MHRRDFLRGSALMTLPLGLQGCGLNLPVSLPARPVEAQPEDEWMDAFGIDERALSRALAALGANGGDFGEIFLQQRSANSLRMTGGRFAVPSGDTLSGAGLRVVRDGRSGFRHVTEPAPETLIAVAGGAAAMIPPTGSGAPRTERIFVPPGNVYSAAASPAGIEHRRNIVARLDALVRNTDDAITDVDISLTTSDERILIATLDGRLVADRRPMTRLSVQAVMTRGGETHAGFAALAGRRPVDWLTEERLGNLAELVVERTRILFDARRPPEGEMPVILAAGTSGVLIHETLGHAFEADFVRAGKSPFSQATGTAVASRDVTLIDDATLAGERGALNVDDEGAPGRRTVLVENGRLKSLVYDRRAALDAGVSPTGNGRRESFAFEPMPRMTCTFIDDGPSEPAELLASLKRGLVAETFTGGSVDLGGGDFRFRVKHGWFVENGRRTVPVRDFELVGNGPRLLRDIRMVANDSRLDEGGWTCGKEGQSVPVSQGAPSLLVAGLIVNPLS